MDREIKFRIWNKSQKVFVDLDKEFDQETKVWDLDLRRKQVYLSHGQYGEHTDLGPQDVILQQFTGLKDKNGKEIYEGDILNVNPKWTAYKNDNRVVSFKNGIFLANDRPLYGQHHLEIVGNIFENPELLKS